MRKAIIGALFIVLSGVTYMAWPFVSAWQLKQAIKSGDLAAIERKVDWVSLRASLQASLVETAGIGTRVVTGGVLQLPGRAPARNTGGSRPSLWQRIKTAVKSKLATRYGPGIIETGLDNLMTPAGLAQAYATREKYRHEWRPAVGYAKPHRALDGTWLEGTGVAKFVDSFERVERVVFTSPSSVEIEIIDRYRPERHYITVMQLQDFAWKLAGLRILPVRAQLAGG